MKQICKENTAPEINWYFLCIVWILFVFSCAGENNGRPVAEQLLGIQEQISVDSLRAKGLTKEQELRLKDLNKTLNSLSKKIQQPLLQRLKYANQNQAVALILLRYGMYTEARRYLDMAIEHEGNNAALFYYRALCSATLMKNNVEEKQRSLYRQYALMDYQRSLEIEPDYTDSLYGLAALRLFETPDYEAAARLLDRYIARRNISKQALPIATGGQKAKTLREAQRRAKKYGSAASTKDINALLMRARAAYGLGRLNEAASFYDWVGSIAISGEIRKRAQELKNQVLQQNNYRSGTP